MVKDAKLYGIKVLNAQGSGAYSDVIAGIDFVKTSCEVKVDGTPGFTTIGGQTTRCVASLSLGGGKSETVNDAVAALVTAGIPVAVAAGNDASLASSYSPASETSATGLVH